MNCSTCRYIGGCPYREEGSCGGRTEELERENYALLYHPPREEIHALPANDELIAGMWKLFNHMFGGAVVSTQSQAVRRWIEEQERKG